MSDKIELKNEKDILEIALNAQSDTFFLFEIETGKAIKWNKSFKEITGYSDEEIASNPAPQTYYSPKDLKKAEKFISKILDDGRTGFIELDLICKNGQTVPTEYRVSPINDKNGLPKYLISIGRDVTKRKQRKEALKESEERFDLAMNATKDGLYDWNLLSNEIYYSPAWKKMLGYKDDELPNDFSVWENTTHPDDVAKAWEMQQELINKKRDQFEMEFKMKHKDGHWVDILSRANAVFNNEGKATRIIGTHVDISERKKSEEALYESENKYRTLFEKTGDASLIVKDNKFVDCNTATLEMVGYDNKEELLQVHPSKLSPPVQPDGKDSYAKAEEMMAIALENGTNRFEWLHKRKNGEIFPVEVLLTAISIRKENVLHVVWRDITSRKYAEEQLIKAKEKAEESDRLKSAFLANMSHEIRTPMNGILGFADLLKKPQLTGEQQKKYIDIIEKSGERMLKIINDLINISKIESGQMKISISETDINEQVEYIYTFFRTEASKKNISLICRTPLISKEAIIETDKEKVYAILTNLVKNAIKYTNEGSIEFGYRKKFNSLEFYVKDSGIGIEKDKQKVIFDRFMQTDISMSSGYEGAGLGLAITKAYVEMLNGKIWVESEIGKGSNFIFTIPYIIPNIEKPASLKDNTTLSSQLSKKLKILIVEDDKASDIYISTLVDSLAKEIIKVKTGEDAVSVCERNPDTDLILMDIKIPVMDGYEATREIRKFNNDVVIIAQTAFGLSGDREKALNSGCNDYISKPIKQGDLFQLIHKHLS